MAAESVQARAAWRVANAQHWVVSDQQLRDLGFSEGAIRHRIRTGRLNRVWPGVFAVARRDLTPYARNPRREAIRIHRRDFDPGETTIRNAIPTTVPLIAILDLAPRLDRVLAIVRRAGLPLPTGQFRRGPHRMDFFWPELNLVVETDGLTYHRTALRFSHAQIRYEPRHVERTLAAVI